jgi:thiol:disulfide interchange protein DsbA
LIRGAATLLAAGLALAAAGAPVAFTPEAGTHYRAVDPPIATEAKPGQVEVIEFFSLGCPACAALEPHLRSWLGRKPPEVAFRRVPATFNAPFKLLAKVQLALSDVGASERLIPVLFDAIHTRKDPALTRPLATWQGMLPKGNAAAVADAERDVLAAFGAFVAARGVDRARFDAALRSPSVALRLAQSDALFKRYGGTGIPAIAVGGRYFTHTARPFSFASYDELLGTVDHLVRRSAAR